ncbi:MAG: preprotein translocase subunit SecA [Aggregatilineales bacterium]
MVLQNLVRRVVGDPNERELRRDRDLIEAINALEPEFHALSDADLRAKTDLFKRRLAEGEDLDDVLVEAFAVVREASVRTIGLRHFDVQLIGGVVLHQGKIAEMKTGEGKTLVATLPLYLNALTGDGAHLVTPNDYLSKVGLQTMGPIYHLLGMKAAVIQNAAVDPTRGSFLYDPTYVADDERYQHLRPISRREAYQADITYGTNNEFGFDYLRDNMVRTAEELVQRGHTFGIVDEVDNILIDEARTPLIISGTADRPSDLYGTFARLVKKLTPSSDQSVEDEEPDGDYVEDPKLRTVYLTESGVEKIETALKTQSMLQGDDLYHPDNSHMIPYLDNSLRAHVIFHRDKDYMVEKGQVIIVDEFTGRPMYGRRFSEGLHQAIEAKENVKVQQENLTLATITFQNYFRLYDKLAGMTGTAKTEADEFEEIYELEVTMIPTHRTVIRKDYEDLVYMTAKAKWDAVVAEIKERTSHGQPVLVGTVAIETSEHLSKLLEHVGVPHNVLNAKQHEREAITIAQAGRPSTVTIATNMAGRGVDILLGGNSDGLAREKLRHRDIELTEATPEQWEAALAEAKSEVARDREIVVAAGGLHVIGTERHEARRIDNQLRGRSGRQGDPGSSRFYLSLEDDLMRRFGGERVKGFMKWADMPEDQPIEHRLITSSIQQAQVRVEGYNFDMRKRVLEYDDVVNKQREVIYQQRRDVLTAENLREQIERMTSEEIGALIETYLPVQKDGDRENWQPQELYQAALALYPVPSHITPDKWEHMTAEEITLELTKGALEAYDAVERRLTPAIMPTAERFVMLRAIDTLWVRHLTDLDILREGIGLVAVGQRDPLVEYKREAFAMWQDLQDQIQRQIVQTIYRLELTAPPPQQPMAVPQSNPNAEAKLTANGANKGGPTNGLGGTMNTINAKNIRATLGGLGAGTPRPNAASDSAPQPIRADAWDKVGRNDPCPCGSGKKFKNCHYPELQRQRQTVDQSEVKRTINKRRH